MTKRNSSSRQHKGCITQLITIGGLIVVTILGALFLLTGDDPVGLFEPVEETPVAGRPPARPGGESGQAAAGRGDWWEVHFTDPNRINDPDDLRGSIPEELIAYIDQAESTIHVAGYEFNLTPVAEALIAAHKRGVEVQWVTDDEAGVEADWEEGHGQFKMLEEAGIEVKDDDRSALMHN